jgi:hypothetical protein
MEEGGRETIIRREGGGDYVEASGIIWAINLAKKLLKIN